MAIVGLLENGDIRATADLGQHPRAPVVDDLGAHPAGRQQAAHKGAVTWKPSFDRMVEIALAQRLTPVGADVPGDHDLPVIAADDPLAIRQLDQHARHRPHSGRPGPARTRD